MLLQVLFQKQVVDFSRVLSFVIIPVIAIVNFRFVTGKFLGKEDQQSIGLKILSFDGIILTGFVVYFLVTIIKFFH